MVVVVFEGAGRVGSTRRCVRRARFDAVSLCKRKKYSATPSGRASATPSSAAAARAQQHQHQQHEFSVFWVPRRSVACERLMEEAGVYGGVAHGELALDMVPLEEV